MRDISASLDSFITNNQEHVEMLKESLRREIEDEIHNYQTEIIAKLDPHKIKERFPNGSADFVDYLNLMNEGYRKRMTDNVNRMTQESVQAYLAKLEKVFDEATGYLRTRKSLIRLEDKFYGSMMESKKGMVRRTTHSAEAPIFKVSVRTELMGLPEKSGMEELRSYKSGHVIGKNPVLRNQQEG